MLRGDYGLAIELSMRAIVRVADAVKAEKLVPITSSHVGSARQIGRLKACTTLIEKLVMCGAKVQVPTSENPYLNDAQDLSRATEKQEVPELQGKQELLDQYYRAIGIIPTRTCTPYLYGNVPRFGQHVSWEESSAVVYVNAVLGARTNRESILMDLLTAIAGRTPFYGLHLNENRLGEILFTLSTRKLNASDYPAIGYHIGKVAGTKIPVLDKLPQDVSASCLKNLGAAAASSGAVSHFHAVGVTPEARSLKDAFGGVSPTDKIGVGAREIRNAKDELSAFNEGERVEAIAVGCPHYSFKEIAMVAKMLEGKKISKNIQFWICTNDGFRMLARESGYCSIIEASGAKLVSICPLALSMTAPHDKMRFMTDSGKLCHYSRAAYGSLKDCVDSSVLGKIVRSEN